MSHYSSCNRYRDFSEDGQKLTVCRVIDSRRDRLHHAPQVLVPALEFCVIPSQLLILLLMGHAQLINKLDLVIGQPADFDCLLCQLCHQLIYRILWQRDKGLHTSTQWQASDHFKKIPWRVTAKPLAQCYCHIVWLYSNASINSPKSLIRSHLACTEVLM